MDKKCRGFKQINFQICTVVITVLFACYVNQVMSSSLLEADTVATEDETVENVGIKVNMNCIFEKKGPIYICRLSNLNSTAIVEVGSVSGRHLPGKTNADVRGIHFKNGVMYYIPTGMEKFFINLVSLVVGDGADKPLSFRSIKRVSFSKLNKLTMLTINTNAIKEFDSDAFWDLPVLRDFLLSASNVSLALNDNVFSKNRNLREIALLRTQLKVITPNMFRNNLLLEAIYLQDCSIKSISSSLFAANRNLGVVSLRSNKIERLPSDLFRNNLLLQIIDFAENNLKTIGVDFSKLHIIDSIDLENNSCIDAYYESDSHSYDYAFTNMTEFQRVIRTNCSAHLSTTDLYLS